MTDIRISDLPLLVTADGDHMVALDKPGGTTSRIRFDALTGQIKTDVAGTVDVMSPTERKAALVSLSKRKPTGLVLEPLATHDPDYLAWRDGSGTAKMNARVFVEELLRPFVEELGISRLFWIYTYYGDRVYFNGTLDWSGQDFGLGAIGPWHDKVVAAGYPAVEQHWPVEESIKLMESVGGNVSLALGQGSDLHLAHDIETGGADPLRYGLTVADRTQNTVDRLLAVYSEYERLFGGTPVWDEVTISHEMNNLSAHEDWVSDIVVANGDGNAILQRLNPRRVYLTPGGRVGDDLFATSTATVLTNMGVHGIYLQDGFSLSTVGEYSGVGKYANTYMRNPYFDANNSLNHDNHMKGWAYLSAVMNSPSKARGFEVRGLKELFGFGFGGTGTLSLISSAVGASTATCPGGFSNGTANLSPGSIITDKTGGSAIVETVTDANTLEVTVTSAFSSTSIAAADWHAVFDDPLVDSNGTGVYRDPVPVSWIYNGRPETAAGLRWNKNLFLYSLQYMIPTGVSLLADQTHSQISDFRTRSNNAWGNIKNWYRSRDERLSEAGTRADRVVFNTWERLVTSPGGASGVLGTVVPFGDFRETLFDLELEIAFSGGTGIVSGSFTINDIAGFGSSSSVDGAAAGTVKVFLNNYEHYNSALKIAWALVNASTVAWVKVKIIEYSHGG
jgi:hypothetical protein